MQDVALSIDQRRDPASVFLEGTRPRLLQVRRTRLDDIETYTALAIEAQARLRERGLGQYVPAAHAEYSSAIRARVDDGSLHALSSGDLPVAFFSVDERPSPWWPTLGEAALYLSGIVVSGELKGWGVGSGIIRWSVREATRRGLRSVRVDCHADNVWLCKYYEARGFVLRGRIEQHPGYVGCLYERVIAGEDRTAGRVRSIAFTGEDSAA